MNISEKQLINMFGVTRQRIHYWRKVGLMPACVPGQKQGYSFQDVLRVKIIVELIKIGVHPRKIYRSLEGLKLMLHKNDVLTGKSLFVCGREIFVFQGGKAITPRTGQYLLFDYDELKTQLGREIRLPANIASGNRGKTKDGASKECAECLNGTFNYKVSGQ